MTYLSFVINYYFFEPLTFKDDAKKFNHFTIPNFPINIRQCVQLDFFQSSTQIDVDCIISIFEIYQNSLHFTFNTLFIFEVKNKFLPCHIKIPRGL